MLVFACLPSVTTSAINPILLYHDRIRHAALVAGAGGMSGPYPALFRLHRMRIGRACLARDLFPPPARALSRRRPAARIEVPGSRRSSSGGSGKQWTAAGRRIRASTPQPRSYMPSSSSHSANRRTSREPVRCARRWSALGEDAMLRQVLGGARLLKERLEDCAPAITAARAGSRRF